MRDACRKLKADLEAMLDAYVDSLIDTAPWVRLLCLPSQHKTHDMRTRISLPSLFCSLEATQELLTLLYTITTQDT